MPPPPGLAGIRGSGFSVDVNQILLRVYDVNEGKETVFSVSAVDPTRTLKGEIEKKMCIPFDDQTLAYKGRELQDDRTFADHNIQENEMLQLMYKVLRPGPSDPEFNWEDGKNSILWDATKSSLERREEEVPQDDEGRVKAMVDWAESNGEAAKGLWAYAHFSNRSDDESILEYFVRGEKGPLVDPPGESLREVHSEAHTNLTIEEKGAKTCGKLFLAGILNQSGYPVAEVEFFNITPQEVTEWICKTYGVRSVPRMACKPAKSGLVARLFRIQDGRLEFTLPPPRSDTNGKSICHTYLPNAKISRTASGTEIKNVIRLQDAYPAVLSRSESTPEGLVKTDRFFLSQLGIVTASGRVCCLEIDCPLECLNDLIALLSGQVVTVNDEDGRGTPTRRGAVVFLGDPKNPLVDNERNLVPCLKPEELTVYGVLGTSFYDEKNEFNFNNDQHVVLDGVSLTEIDITDVLQAWMRLSNVTETLAYMYGFNSCTRVLRDFCSEDPEPYNAYGFAPWLGRPLPAIDVLKDNGAFYTQPPKDHPPGKKYTVMGPNIQVPEMAAVTMLYSFAFANDAKIYEERGRPREGTMNVGNSSASMPRTSSTYPQMDLSKVPVALYAMAERLNRLVERTICRLDNPVYIGCPRMTFFCFTDVEPWSTKIEILNEAAPEMVELVVGIIFSHITASGRTITEPAKVQIRACVIANKGGVLGLTLTDEGLSRIMDPDSDISNSYLSIGRPVSVPTAFGQTNVYVVPGKEKKIEISLAPDGSKEAIVCVGDRNSAFEIQRDNNGRTSFACGGSSQLKVALAAIKDVCLTTTGQKSESDYVGRQPATGFIWAATVALLGPEAFSVLKDAYSNRTPTDVFWFRQIITKFAEEENSTQIRRSLEFLAKFMPAQPRSQANERHGSGSGSQPQSASHLTGIHPVIHFVDWLRAKICVDGWSEADGERTFKALLDTQVRARCGTLELNDEYNGSRAARATAGAIRAGVPANMAGLMNAMPTTGGASAAAAGPVQTPGLTLPTWMNRR